MRRHNFIGFTGEMMKAVTASKLKEGNGAYEKWIEDAKAKTKERVEEKRKKGGGEKVDV